MLTLHALRCQQEGKQDSNRAQKYLHMAMFTLEVREVLVDVDAARCSWEMWFF